MDDKTIIIILSVINICMWIAVIQWMSKYVAIQHKMAKTQMEYYHHASQLNADLADELVQSMNRFIEEIRELQKDGDNGKISFKKDRG